jgi:hypothetical protein
MAINTFVPPDITNSTLWPEPTNAATNYRNQSTAQFTSITDQLNTEVRDKLQITTGTFTPVLLGSTTAGTPTYTEQTGRYVRLGKSVQFVIQIAISNKGGIAGNVRISGLPVTPKNFSVEGVTIVRIENWTKPADFVLLTPTIINPTIEIRYSRETGVTALLGTSILDTFLLRLSGLYEID